MPITAVDYPDIRRLEAVSFRSFPSTTTYFNGAWAIRLTDCHPAKRLNSINPLDPGDSKNIEQRVEHELSQFQHFGRTPTFRLTPLAPKSLVQYLDRLGWEEIEESAIMCVDLDKLDLDLATNLLPYKDIDHWVSAFLTANNNDMGLKSGLVSIINATQSKTGLFLLENENQQPASVLRCVLNDNLAGLFDVATALPFQRTGLATSLMLSALQWARQEGATKAWLQMVTTNVPAMNMYSAMGFKEVYRYVYRRQPKAPAT